VHGTSETHSEWCACLCVYGVSVCVFVCVWRECVRVCVCMA